MISWLMCLIISFSAVAADFEADLKFKIAKEQKSLLEVEVKKRGILGTLYQIHRQTQKLNDDITLLDSKASDAKKAAERSAKETLKLNGAHVAIRKVLSRRMRAMYKMGLNGMAEVVVSSQSNAEFSRNLKYFYLVSKKDTELLGQYKSNLTQLNASRRRFAQQVATFEKFQSDLKSELVKIDIERVKQKTLLSEVEKDRSHHMKALGEWRQAGKELEKRMAELDSSALSKDVMTSAFFEQKGRLSPPIFGSITQKYGIIHNKRFNTKIFHKGIFISGVIGLAVSAIHFGTVAFSGWLNGYGETVILDHGNQYYSLYAHNSTILKKIGEAVKSGEVIAKVGETASLRGPGVYMEIRHFSESLDPEPWLDLSLGSGLK